MKTICLARRWLVLGAVACTLLGGCQRRQHGDNATVTIAVEGDVDTFNPLFTEELVSAEITELLFPRLVEPEFDTARGVLSFSPLLASAWDFSDDKREITFHLRTDAQWSDGVRVTAHDVQFSFELYADTVVASVRQGVTQNLRRTNGRLDISRSAVALNDSTVLFRFEKASPSLFFDIGVPVLPSHVLRGVARNQLRAHAFNKTPVTSGPFLLERHVPLQEIVLAANTSGWCGVKPKISRLVFKVLPDYRTRVAQLESGEVDIVAGLRIEDAKLFSRAGKVEIVSTMGRDYDFIGWNNIDPEAYRKSNGAVIRPHPLFGSKNVRKALTMAIDREEIVRAYLGEHGAVAVGGISPLFKWAFNDTLRPLPVDKERAMHLLQAEGWSDRDGNGVLEKNGKNFSFVLKLASGNALRDVIAAVVQQRLQELKIEMRIEKVERGTFWNDLMERKYDAWIAGFRLPLQMELDAWWSSDLKRSPFNLVGFRHPRVDEILKAVKERDEQSEAGALWKEFQVIVHEEQPYTFLFWINELVGVNKRVKGTHIGILGTTHKAWEWQVE
jgi:peptide/nickel transport system substrate-binding protein